MPQIYGYALSGVARCGATRFGAHSAKVFVSLGGSQYATGRLTDAKRILALSITDRVSTTPNTAQLTTQTLTPFIGEELIVTLGSINNYTREFAGTVLQTRMSSVGGWQDFQHDVSAVDYTCGLNARKVNKLYTNQTIAAIISDLVTTYASGYTASVDATFGATVLNQISITDRDLTDALTQVTKRGGGDWRCDYHK